MSFPLSPGDTIDRARLHDIVGGRRQGRISPSRVTPNVLLFTSPGAVDSLHDGWTGDRYHFQGEGVDGDQVLAQGNRALREHADTGRKVRLFSTRQKPTVRYLGEYALDTETPYVSVTLPVAGQPTHPQRAGYVFRLQPVDGTTPTRVPRARSLSVETQVVEVDVNTSFRPRPGSEPGHELTSVEDSADRELTRYATYLRLQGHDVRRYMVTPAQSLSRLPVDLLDRTANELVACTGSVARSHVLAALGELLDLRRFFLPQPAAVLLAPTAITMDLIELCMEKGITTVWPEDDGFRRTDPPVD
ncbi:hypothetical protein [Streptomyces sp. NPDC051572]|uniref:hypothetical protein n=1 Tax=Streptomyces sp. NPDC051572 TaxID=3155802 RepID=UPI003450AFA5